ncbi:uncharacterized protein GGS22DRAFT_152379 [Annulohypoxylon maeteangense]|uniref:uncharacterized protein n=1 Tax=Annulohypoxylon maeteangense TaxID=1927788 RepID=UPI0020074FD4|nr:uncharacterized protein GGS22DRAFT_152379 [Annulohypoxylon maeteangense]KAI0888803.1 hypothetical protein GGS22DRAFT_152379 [Annulohypoxylon maeteangense]
MLFPERDAPLLRQWIIRRLANTSDADADVLADYVLALLRHDGDVGSIRKIFEDEIPDFLREDAAEFTNDVFQAIKYRSYLPGAPPAPSAHIVIPPLPAAPTNAQPLPHLKAQIPYPPNLSNLAAPTYAPSGSKKRPYNDRDDEVDIILNGQGSYPHPFKQPRRDTGFIQRGRFDNPYGSIDRPTFPPSTFHTFSDPNRPSLPPPPLPQLSQFQPQHDQHMAQMNPNMLNQLGFTFSQEDNLPKPVYSGTIPTPRRRKRCRDYDTKGYCSRGNKCRFDHGMDSLTLPPLGPSAGDEYDPSNAIFTMPLPNIHQSLLPKSQSSNLPPFPATPPNNRRDANKGPKRMKGKVPFAAVGSVNDKSKTSLVVQNIPLECFTDAKIREYFSQFGNILEVSMQTPDPLAIVKFDTWDAAHAAWSSPKVIFDNRFVKVFWYKDEAEAGSAPINGKIKKIKTETDMNGDFPADSDTPSAEPFDMDEFLRKQEEAQKAHEEKSKKREELERQRQELEERQKELRARQLEEKLKLQAKLTKNGGNETTVAADGAKKPVSQTDALRAQLAALEEEANVLGIDPDAVKDEFSSWNPRGRGRGSRGYRGRGRFVTGAYRGAHGFQGRGGVEARHAAYAVYSLDNRPKVIVLSGVDFTNPEKDEALRQYLFGIGEFKEIHTDPKSTHVTFKDRKTAEQFMFGVSANNAIPGLDDKVEIAWTASAPQSEKKVTADDDVPMTTGVEDEQTGHDKTTTEDNGVNAELEEGEVDNSNSQDQHDMDYESGQGWDIS